MESRTYSIGGHPVRLELEAPWTFKALSPRQEEMVAVLAAGGDLGIRPVPADHADELPVNDALLDKEIMTRERWDTLGEGEREQFRHDLDLFQYAPFELPEGETPLFTLTVRSQEPAWLQALQDPSAPAPEMLKARRVVSVDEVLPCYYGYRHEGFTIYTYFPRRDRCAGIFVMSGDYRTGIYYPKPGMGPRTTLMQVNTSLMIQYTFATAGLDTLLLHASVVRHEGKAGMFFGVSGTGKSTHSRLWLEHVEGTDLMNDDNPIIRFDADGHATVYGTPWSGKTVCYRRVQAPVRALVRLEQAPVNAIERLSDPLSAYASVLAAVSTIRWDSAVMDRLVPTLEKAVAGIPCYKLACRPDREAVLLCQQTIESL